MTPHIGGTASGVGLAYRKCRTCRFCVAHAQNDRGQCLWPIGAAYALPFWLHVELDVPVHLDGGRSCQAWEREDAS